MADSGKLRVQRLYYSRAKAGLCTGCGGAPAPGRRQCGPCLEYLRTRVAAWRRGRAAVKGV